MCTCTVLLHMCTCVHVVGDRTRIHVHGTTLTIDPPPPPPPPDRSSHRTLCDSIVRVPEWYHRTDCKADRIDHYLRSLVLHHMALSGCFRSVTTPLFFSFFLFFFWCTATANVGTPAQISRFLAQRVRHYSHIVLTTCNFHSFFVH